MFKIKRKLKLDKNESFPELFSKKVFPTRSLKYSYVLVNIHLQYQKDGDILTETWEHIKTYTLKATLDPITHNPLYASKKQPRTRR